MHLRRITSTSLLALVATTVPLALPARAAEVPTSVEPVVVRFDADVAEADQAAALAAAGLTLLDRLPGSDFALAAPRDGVDPAAGAAGDGIADVDPVVTYQALGVPNDPAYKAQWHLPAIDAASAWDVTTGTGTIVAVIDTGVAYETTGSFVQAPDLAGTSFVPGWDFVGGDSHPNDENGHGTHVTGSVAQTTNNGVGAAGAAPGASIMPLRVLDATGAGSDFNVAQAIRFAADHGADVANLSLGGQGSSSVMRDAIAYATGKGVVVVAAAGNDGVGTVSYPAADPNVIGVGTVRYDRTRPAYGNYGSALDLVAPGGDSSVDQNGDGYGDGILQQTFKRPDYGSFSLRFMQGTSMAAPQVSAVAALVASRGVTDRLVIEQVLKSTAVDLGPAGWDEQYGGGLVQAGAAVRAPLSTTPAVTEPAPTEPAPIEPAPTEPAPTAPAPTAPAPTEPAPTAPAPTVPAPSEPAPTEPVTTEPVTIEPAPEEPVAIEPAPEEPAVTEPAPEEPIATPTTATGEPRGIELACPASTTPASAFVDLAGSVHVPGITCAAWWGVASGRTATTFDPAGPVTRGQLASFVARTLETAGLVLPTDAPDAFGDDAASVHQPRINQLAALKVVQGRGDGTFAPDAVVTRAEMATFLVRAHDALAATALPAGGDRFADDNDSVHAGNIDKMAAAGLAGGTSTTTYAPTAPVQRGQMATFLSRTLDLFVADGDTAAR